MGGFENFMAGPTMGLVGKKTSLTDLLFGEKEKQFQMSTMTPEQQGVLKQLMGGLQGATPEMFSYLSDLLSGDSQSFKDFSNPMMRQFQEETIPGIAERFGGVGAQSSSGFQQSLGKAGAGLQENLAALRSQLQMGASQQLQGLMGQGLGVSSFDNIHQRKGQGLFQNMAAGVGQSLGKAGTSAMMA